MESPQRPMNAVLLNPAVSKFQMPLFWVGIALLGAGVALGASMHDGYRRALFAYLLGCTYFLSLSTGALFFVVLQHLTGSTWSITIRRLAEITAGAFTLLALLEMPIILSVLGGSAAIYPWNDRQFLASHELLQQKQAYLNARFFAVRCCVYFAVWIAMSRFFIARSGEQDHTADPRLTLTMRAASAPAALLLLVTVTFAAFDLLMSLDPSWYSTIFGVYYLSGCIVAFCALLALLCVGVQASGSLQDVITKDHYHDVGKLLFAFVFFWGYIAFSQYLLIWYANLPEETSFYLRRSERGWMYLSVSLLFLHFLLPFVGMMSRRAKRSKWGLASTAALVLLMQGVDLYWIVLPNYQTSPALGFALDGLMCAGVGCLFAGNWIRQAGGRSLLAFNDPQLERALALRNH